ncbi:hypothetical protein [Bdellovibrio svalbardensis]|uniref:Lipoprotein n=1 Tax=Bdellovibrio svalbardensis TaxID=2972972 RepID=A0ABT6DI38_9BACT|nr:hypothetical protein [Bdellovibrio svalbardensis]MDG0816152.1 hypothetical protein [Bdellovibrio svalbardensis]
MEKLILRFPILKLSRLILGQFSIVSTSPLLLVASLCLTACSSGTADDNSGIDSYTQTSGSFSEASSTTVAGTGSIRFVNVMNGVFSSNSLALKAELDNSTNSITAILNSNNTLMNSSSGGVAVTFTRSGASVTGSIAVNGSSVTMNQSRLSFYVPTALDLIIEVHNISATKSRVLLWLRDAVTYSAGNADIDTENTTDYTGTYPSTGGSGQFYGLSLNNAKVTGATLGLQKVAN